MVKRINLEDKVNEIDFELKGYPLCVYPTSQIRLGCDEFLEIRLESDFDGCFSCEINATETANSLYLSKRIIDYPTLQECANALALEWFSKIKNLPVRVKYIKGTCNSVDGFHRKLDRETTVETDWETLCRWSRCFSNSVKDVDHRKDYFYAHEKPMGAWKGFYSLKETTIFWNHTEKENIGIIKNNPVSYKEKTQNNGWGVYRGYCYEANTVMFASSCNDNIAIAEIGEDEKVKIIFSTKECNYYRFFSKQPFK